MNLRCNRIRNLALSISLILILIPNSSFSQFEQKLSVNVSAGYFNTFGTSGYEYDSSTDPYTEPSLMPNFQGGPSIFAGLQYNFSRHFSLEFQFGFSFSPNWYFDASDGGSDPLNYTYYEIYRDTSETEVVASGENYMDLTNFHFGLVPRYYFSPGKKFNPFIYAGINFNITDVWFEDQEYEAYKSLGRLEEYEGPGDIANWFDYHNGIGFIGGAGVEYALNESVGLFATASYHYIPLKEEAFIYGIKYADYHAINIHLGARFSILKSKEL